MQLRAMRFGKTDAAALGKLSPVVHRVVMKFVVFDDRINEAE